MKGIQYVTNDIGKKTGVLIDLNIYQDMWEDFYDNLVANTRANESRQTLSEVKDLLKKSGKLHA